MSKSLVNRVTLVVEFRGRGFRELEVQTVKDVFHTLTGAEPVTWDFEQELGVEQTFHDDIDEDLDRG